MDSQVLLLNCLVQSETRLLYSLMSLVDEPKLRRQIVGSTVKDVATFFYLLKINNISSSGLIVSAAKMHNAKIDEICCDQVFLDILGRTKAQIIDSKFNERGLIKLQHNFEALSGSIDQSDISRFLVLQMSQESCRSAIELLAQIGLLERTKLSNGSIVVKSKGILEELVDQYLFKLRGDLEGILKE